MGGREFGLVSGVGIGSETVTSWEPYCSETSMVDEGISQETPLFVLSAFIRRDTQR